MSNCGGVVFTMTEFETQLLDQLSSMNDHLILIRGAVWCICGILLCMGCFKWR